MKTCTKCGQEKDLKEFHKDKHNPDGLTYACKECRNNSYNTYYKKTGYNIYKDPVTDDGTKKSLKGLICVTEDHEVLTQCTWEQESQGILQTIYEDGQFHNQTTLKQIRERLNNTIK